MAAHVQIRFDIRLSPPLALVNEMRKDFTVSERVAIARAIEERLAARHGVRHDRVDMEIFPHLDSGPSRDLAAKQVGFGSGKTYEAAKKAVDALPDLKRGRSTQFDTDSSCEPSP